MNINKTPNTDFKNEFNEYTNGIDEDSNIEFIQIRYTDVIGKF